MSFSQPAISIRPAAISPLAWAITAMVVAHAALIGIPSINNEFAFEDAARYFLTSDVSFIQEYFSVQANTVTLPWTTAALSRLLPGVPLLVLMRVLGLLGVLLLSLGMYRICRALGRGDAQYLIPFLLLSPLVWIYTGRATADFIPVSVAVFAISMVLHDELTFGRAAASGMVFGAAVILKYHAIVLLFPLLSLYVAGVIRLPRVAATVCFVLPVLALFAGYLVMVHQHFGFWVTPPQFQVKHQIGFAGWLSNFICYAGYLVLLTLPTLVLLPEARAALLKRWKVLGPALVVLLLAGLFWVTDNGEMNLGPLDRWVPESLRLGAFAVISAGMLLPLLLSDGKGRAGGRRVVWMIWAACLIILFVLSLTRPAQRYLLFVLPFFVLTLPPRIFTKRGFYAITLVLFCLGNAFIEYSRWCTGSAAQAMATLVEQRGLVRVTDAGAIAPHAASAFFRASPLATEYVVVLGKADDAVIVTQSGVAGLVKYFSLVPTSPRQTELNR